MIQLYDYFGHAEIPNIVLCNPNGDELYYLSQYIYNDKITLRFNALSEFEFEIPSTTNNGITTAEFYPYIQSKRLIYIQNIGYFIIYGVEEDTTGANPTKKVMCRSIEGELISKKISAFSGTYKFYDPTHVTTNLIDTIMDYIPSWSIGTIDSTLVDKYRTFDITDSTIYSFLMVDVEKAMQCVFSFDFINKTISAYAVENATTDTDIYLSFDNLIEKIQLKEISDEIVTALSVFGGNGLTIRAVNPMGGNLIYNFDYFKTTSWMTQALIDAIDAWEAAIAVAQPTYASNLTSLKTKNGEIYDLRYNVTTGYNKLLADLSALEALQQAAVIAVPPDPVEIENIADDIAAKQVEILAKKDEIIAKQVEIDAVNAILQGIVASLSFSNNFTTQQLEDLSLFMHENTFTNEMIITTSIMTDVEVQEASQNLYDQAVIVLEKASQPRYEFSVDSANFVALKEFQQFTNQLVLGAKVTLDKMGTLIESVLLEVNMSFKNPTDFNLVFSNRLRLDNGSYQYSDILGQSVSTGNSVTANTLQWNEFTDNYQSAVSTFLTSALDAATNNVINSSNQEMVINAYGLRGKKLISPGNYSPKEMWMTNNILAFTDDGWQTSKLALGTIETDAGDITGLVADVIVGRLLAGQSLTITNDDGIITKTFTLDQNGAVLRNSDLVVETDFTKIILDPEDGIKIQGNAGIINVEKGNTYTGTGLATTSVSFSTSVSSNSNRLLLLLVGSNSGLVTNAVFGTQSFTKLVSIKKPSGNTAVSEIWYLVNPINTTSSIVVNFASSSYVEISATEFYNVDQNDPIGSFYSGSGNNTVITSSPLEATGKDVVVDNLCYWDNTFAVLKHGRFQESLSFLFSDGNWRQSCSYKDGAGFDTTVSVTSQSVSVDFAYTAVVLLANKNVTTSWEDVFKADLAGNINFKGNLSGASGFFTGDVTAKSGFIGDKWIIKSDGIYSSNETSYLKETANTSAFFKLGSGFEVSWNIGGTSLLYFAPPSGDVYIIGNQGVYLHSSGGDMNLGGTNVYMNGQLGVTGTYSGLKFQNGLFIGV